MRILLLDNDTGICDAIRFSLKQEGYDVDICQDGEEGILWMMQQVHDLVLLDRTLPKRDGVAVLKEARRNGVCTPVIILSAIDTTADKIAGLDAGADDYLTKPFATGELLARIRACVRRPKTWWPESIVTFADLKLNVKARILEWRECSCELTQRETTLFEILMKSNGAVVARDAIFAYIWGVNADVDQGILDSYIRHARNRLKEIGGPAEIRTIRYTGYCLSACSMQTCR